MCSRVRGAEFVDAMHRQMMTVGGGELAAVVTQTSSFFGVLNPFSWLAKPQTAPPTTRAFRR